MPNSALKSNNAILQGGDHENYYVQHDLTKYSILYQNGSLVNAVCEAKAVRIRTITGHTLWPNIFRTTLLFSSKRVSGIDTFDYENDMKPGDIGYFNDSTGNYHKAVKPNYG